MDQKVIKEIDNDEKKLPEEQNFLPKRSDDYQLKHSKIETKDCVDVKAKKIDKTSLIDSFNKKSRVGYIVEPNPEPIQNSIKNVKIKSKLSKNSVITDEDYNKTSIKNKWGFQKEENSKELFKPHSYLLLGHEREYPLIDDKMGFPKSQNYVYNLNPLSSTPTFKKPFYRN